MKHTDLYATIRELSDKNDFFGIIRLIDRQKDPDYDLTLEFARACINASNTVQDGYALLDAADKGLDSWATEGKDDPAWLFYKGYVLFKQGLVPEALIRFEHAMRYVDVSRSELMSKIATMLDICRTKMFESEFSGLSPSDRELVQAHIVEYFGPYVKLGSSCNVDILRCPPHEGHDYQLLVTCGLAGKKLAVPEGYDEGANSHLELALALPKDYDFSADKVRNWEVFLLISLIEHVISSQNFIGFGYFTVQDAPFSAAADYRGMMLTGMGDYSGLAQSVTLGDGTLAHFFQVIPLRPLECAYRENHGALDLLNVFREKNAELTPFRYERPDYAALFNAKIAGSENN